MKRVIDSVKVLVFILGGLGLLYTIYIHLNAIDYVDISDGDKIPGYLELGSLLSGLLQYLLPSADKRN